MGNNNTRESRGQESSGRGDGGTSGPASPTTSNQPRQPYDSRGGRSSRAELSSILGIGSSNNDIPERRETKQEREVRKLEKERAARVKERERSIKEEHVDGGYLVTMGVYTGHEDFNKVVVRQLMIERRMAPFWRGLDDFNDGWAEHQIVAAGRGLPIPAADEMPPEDLTRALSPESAHASNNNLQNLMVPIGGRSLSAASDASTTLPPSHPTFSPASPAPPAQSSSPFRPRSKTLASLTTSSKNGSSSTAELTPREIQLPHDPYINGQQLELFLYKDAAECPICFLYYPPYLNKTRCCDQPICSECFVQIKRPDPHPPEHEHNDPSNPNPTPPVEPPADAEQLVSEPSTCPYCQAPEFGVTFEAPPFRRGLSYANLGHGLSSLSSAMSSSSSLNSTASPAVVPNTHKRRTTSISATAPTVITTDRIRPDWATKLSSARSHLARRSAAATALHTAAYLMNGNTENRGFSFGGRSRFGRHRNENSPSTSGAATPSPVTGNEPRSVADQASPLRREASGGDSSRRRTRLEDLEDMMMMEAIRMSLEAEEERKKKAEKEAAKEAKKKAKEDRKREKKERKVYGSGASSASGSALSLSLPGIGRRRGNSGASNLAREVTQEQSEPSDSKGKAVDRGHAGNVSLAPMDIGGRMESVPSSGIPGARHVDSATLATISDSHQSSSSPTAPDKPSHLRQMSNASSPASSFVESAAGSFRNDHYLHGSSSNLESPASSSNNVAKITDEAPHGDDSNANPALESMFNFQSLAAMIDKEDSGADDKRDAARHVEHLNGDPSESRSRENSGFGLGESVATLQPSRSSGGETGGGSLGGTLDSARSTPKVMVTPETPAAINEREEEGKQLGAGWNEQVPRAITQ
ncbi:hypothetical protein BJ875DRAFT_31110 [Amylocarpus encephaloides]|uniref:Protein sip5 n=1 Tax=Amylocarpus encephaloides TaxID=45428 RepID=A0A9P7YHU6_9HELO|nr:hypothetical protein BJ875DRAFT_31110 [Amylocarpus encephaloides]